MDIKRIIYQGVNIKKVYACCGDLVWNTKTPYKFIATYSGGETNVVFCNGSSTLTQGEVETSGYEASAMTSAIIGNCVTSTGKNAFNRCKGLISIDIPNSIISIADGSFAGCLSLSSITIPSGVTNIGEAAFFRCDSLTSVTIHATTPPTLGNLVFHSTNDCPIYVPSASLETYKAAGGWSNYASRIQAIA